METDVEFSYEELDALSDTPLMHLSYMIQALLPIRLVGWENVKRHYESLSSHTHNLSQQSSTDTYIVTGSNAEGYAIPYSVTRTDPPIIERPSDVDMLWVPQYLQISTSKLPQPNDTHFKGYLEYEGIQPGYVRICLPKVKEKDESFIYNENTGMFYLSSTIMMEKVQSVIPNFCLEKSERAWVQGPAFTVEDDQVLTRDRLYEPNVGASRDFVTALACSPWPDIASGWKSRASKSSWLDPHLVDSIIADGCHVVAVPSKNSLRPELEWRISFSASEGRIAREAVNDYQRQCYIYVKILRKQVMGNVSVLSSYVFKSVFLYCCMNLPTDHWKKYPGNCVLYILDVLLECLGRKHVPTFFLPENNLIGHMSDEEIDTAIGTVVSMRCDPVTPILDYMDTRILGYQSVIATFREVLKPLLEDMKMFKVHRDKNISIMNGIIASGYNICHYILHENPSEKEARTAKHQEAINCLIDIYTLWLVPAGLDATLFQFINSAGLMIKDLAITCRFFEAVVSLSADYPTFASARGNLACMYHSLAYSAPEGSVLRDEYLNKAGHLFKEVYEENKSSAIDYVTYLVKIKMYKEAKSILEEFIEHLESHAPSRISYSEKEKDTLDDPLRHHVQVHGKVEADDITFAYYYVVRCEMALSCQSKTAQVSTALSKLKAHCEDCKTDCTFDFYSEAKKMSVDGGTIMLKNVISPAAGFMLMAVGIPAVFSLIINAIKHT